MSERAAPLALGVELERPYDFYTEGDIVNGHVVISVRQDVALRSLEVAHVWRTFGGAASDEEHVIESRRTKSNRLKAGGEHRVPFEFMVSRTPVTHHGEHLRVSWLVTAAGQLADDSAVTAEAEYVHLAGERKPHKKGKDLIKTPSPEGERNTRRFKKRCATGGTIRPPRLWPGETTVCTLVLKPRDDMDFTALSASLVRERTAVTGKKKSPSVDVKRDVVRSVKFDRQVGEAANGETITLECVLTVPEDAESSLAKPRERVEWLVELGATATGCPQLKERFPLIVLGSDDAS